MKKHYGQLPADENFRNVLSTSIHLIHTYVIVAQVRSLPYEEIEKIISREQSLALYNKIEKAPRKKILGLTEEEMLMLYSALDLASKVLISKYGEVVGTHILEGISDTHDLKQYSVYRDSFILFNSTMINSIEKKTPPLPGLPELKATLAEISL